MKNNVLLLFLLLSFTFACSSESQNTAEENTTLEKMYFPPISELEWETRSMTTLGWNTSNVQNLLDYLQLKNTKSFMILQNGRIVMENYFDGHTASSPWYWASAGKTLISITTGIAEQEGLINTNNKVSTYIGTGWTSETLAQENLITCKNLLNMTSGLDDAIGDDVSPANLRYKANAGKRWAYHNVFVKLQDVVSQASGKTWDNYFNTRLRDKIGMTGSWITADNNIIYWSNTRSMARFGLLALNNGSWNGTPIINSTFFQNATNTSQNINLSYGYLWWLNGKSSYHLPQTQLEFSGSIIPNAPKDMYCALGKNDQKIYVVPSKNLVIVRMGNSSDPSNFGLSDFDPVLWQKINSVIN